MTASSSFQSTYPLNMPIGIDGRPADCGFNNKLSPTCLENINSGLGVVKPLYVDYAIALPRNDMASSVFDADLILDNVVNFTVNGVAITPITYATSHLETMQKIAFEIVKIPTVENAIVGGAGNRTITIISKAGTASNVTVATVTGGATQAVITTTAGQSGVFFGVVQAIYNRMQTIMPDFGANLTNSTGVVSPYFKGNPAPTMTQGRIYVTPEDVVTSNSPVYLRIVPTVANPTVGKFRSDADGGNAVLIPVTSAIWREGNGVVGGLAVLELNIP